MSRMRTASSSSHSLSSPQGWRSRSLALSLAVAAALGLVGAGCFAPPETCGDCNGPGVGGNGGSTGGGGDRGSGGTSGTGGMLGTGGANASGGAPGTDGGSGTGGSGSGGKTGSGGAGLGGSGLGGTGAGGTGLGGSGLGGAGMGGSGVGGASVGGAGMGGAGVGGVGGAVIDSALVAWYQMDDGSGTTAVDGSGHGRNATLTPLGGGTAAFSTTHQVGTGAMNLASSSATVGGFAVVPASMQTMGATTAITISCWVNVRTERAWERIFDFGNSQTTGYMFLSTAQAQTTPNSPRFAISMTGNTAEQMINMTTPAVLSTNTWHHIAVVLGAGATYTGTLYIDKMVAGTNTAMTLRPSNLGSTSNNWIGRSQFSTADPLFDGLIDDFRIYSRALTATEITALP